MAWSLARVSASSATGSESATMPTPAHSRAVVPVELGGADADGPAAVAGAVDPADRTGVAAPVAGLEPGDQGEGGVAGVTRRPPASGAGPPPARGPTAAGSDSRPSTIVARCCTLATATIEGSASSSRYEHQGSRVSMDQVDGDLVLVPVLGRRQQAGGQAGVGGRVAAPGGGAGHRVRAHHVAVAGDEELGAGAHEAVDRRQDTAREGGGAAGAGHRAGRRARSVSTTSSRARTTLRSSPVRTRVRGRRPPPRTSRRRRLRGLHA